MMLLTIDSDLTEVTYKSLISNILQHKIDGKCVQLFRHLLIFVSTNFVAGKFTDFA